MSSEKLSSDEVPQKFVDWLLAMEYPPEKLPSVEKITQMCRGQYYLVWRSLMEHVQPKDDVREKRLKVFCDDITLCQKNNVFKERDSSVVIPEQLLLWRQHDEIQKKVANAEARVAQAREDLTRLMDKVSSRYCQRDMLRRKEEDKQRHLWLLRQVAEDLSGKKANLEQTMDIAKSLCPSSEEDDLQAKVDKCLDVLRRGSPSGVSQPVASSSVLSTQGDDTEDQLASLSRASGDALWTILCARRAKLHAALAQANALHSTTQSRKDHRGSLQSVLAHTASLHCSLSLGAIKNRALVKQAGVRFASYIEDISQDYINGDACELLVLQCKRASTEARVNSLRTLLDELTTNSGAFEVARETSDPVNGRQISDLNNTIENTREKLKQLIVSLAATERKILSIKEVLSITFSFFQGEVPIDRYRDIQLNFPQESIAKVCQFYSEKREERRNKAECSMNFDTSDGSIDQSIDLSSPRFIDELKFYLKKFNLEKNRKLVMESGEKVWIFETLQSSLERLYSKWLSEDVTPLLCPSASLSRNLRKIITDKQTKSALESVLRELDCNEKHVFNIDITSIKEQEEAVADKIKKQISENLQSLQKSAKLLEYCQENLHLWQDNEVKKYISNNRTVNGKTYKEYEAFYTEALLLNA